MRRAGNRFRKQASWWLVMVLMVAFGGAAGCATTRNDQAGEVRVRTIWNVRDQYVAIEKVDSPAPANAHPADISADRLRSALASVEVRIPGKDGAVQLFNDPELDILADHIRAGLAAAGPDEDVTFAVIGHYTTLLGVFKERKVTTGRVFCRDGRLNVIFGELLRDVREDEDRRLYPFLAGSRGAAAPLKLALTAKPGGETFASQRPDWITFPIAGPAAPIALPAALRDTGGATQGSKAAAPAAAPGKPGAAGRKSVEERLMILNELRSKKLITDEEYRAKRLEILNEL